jgi:apolipoprotein N-acyltransferase
VDNALVNHLAPWTGVYGISFLVVAVNALIAGGLLLACCPAKRFGERHWWGAAGALLLVVCSLGVTIVPSLPVATATAVLIQPNLDVAIDNTWTGEGEWDAHMRDFKRLAGEQCKTYIAGIPETGAGTGEIVCPPYATYPDLILWPESPSPYFEMDTRFRRDLAGITRSLHAPLIIDSYGMELSAEEGGWRTYNSALVLSADGQRVGRYDKIHLVPFGEFIPFQNLLTFARKLTGRVSTFTRGSERKVFRLADSRGDVHSYGVFICYEAVFGDEVREFARNGAEVLVNLSDDGWYGDTSAPWQHLNMARMRAIENRRWILRDTNNGITAAIDPCGRVRQSIPRHAVDALPAQFGFSHEVTFYTAHGDVFAWLCALATLALVGWAVTKKEGPDASQG